jgi:hypothetical protein
MNSQKMAIVAVIYMGPLPPSPHLLSDIYFVVQASIHQAPGSGRARRDAAARAMQGWHAQRLVGYGEIAEPIVKVC